MCFIQGAKQQKLNPLFLLKQSCVLETPLYAGDLLSLFWLSYFSFEVFFSFLFCAIIQSKHLNVI